VGDWRIANSLGKMAEIGAEHEPLDERCSRQSTQTKLHRSRLATYANEERWNGGSHGGGKE
jgi:hypothetical protein